MKHLFNRFLHEESGQDMIEYILILAFVVIGAAGIAYGIGGDLKNVWQETSKATSDAKVKGVYTQSS
jgi:Flp pilus assembly pilin Flp